VKTAIWRNVRLLPTTNNIEVAAGGLVRKACWGFCPPTEPKDVPALMPTGTTRETWESTRRPEIVREAFEAEYGPTNVQPDESFPNACGVWCEDYVADERTAADIWSVPLIDLYRESGLTPTCEEHYRYFHDADTDRLHPNDHGQARIAETILAKMRTLPPEYKIREGVHD